MPVGADGTREVAATVERAAPAAERQVGLEPVPDSARTARQVVAEALRQVGRPDLADTAELLVSELVTNAIVHARTAIGLSVLAGADGLRVSVHDGSAHLPSSRRYGVGATTGRGLALVAQLSDRHGVASGPDGGKSVWFELGVAPGGTGHRTTTAGPEAADPATARTATVVLRDVPVLLARAWCQHVDTLLREHLLARWESATGSTGPGAVDPADGRAGDAFAVLADALGALTPGPAATARAEVTLHVPVSATPWFAALSSLLDEVVVQAERGLMLAPVTQPEVQMLRRWMCEEVGRQAAGAPPTPWPGLPAELESRGVPAPTFDVGPVLGSEQAVLAADDANRIMAASPAALRLLGWDGDLVGRRVAAIIPARLREAHVAGFTLHLLTGSGPIVDREVTVPALRRDGSEVPVVLLVQRRPASDGRPVFVATLREA